MNTNIDESEVKIVAVDLQTMDSIPGVAQIQGDITKMETAKAIIHYFQEKSVQLVLCDGAPDVSNLHDVDNYIQHKLLLAAFNIATCVLAPGATFVAKIFRGKKVESLLSMLQKFFGEVIMVKPYCSRNSSNESFILCKNYYPSTQHSTIDTLLLSKKYAHEIVAPTSCCVIFKALKEDKTYDPDTSYPLKLKVDDNYEYRCPSNKPISPPYADAIAAQQTGHFSHVLQKL